jgi:hypothetical protein
MFERSFLWAMKYGARVLFTISLLYLLAGLVQAVILAGSAVNIPNTLIGRASWMLMSTGLFGTLSTFGMLLFGAVVIDRLDRWLFTRKLD